MINEESIRHVKTAQFSEHFVRPLYDTYCFSRIPGTISSILMGKDEAQALPAKVFGHLPRRAEKVVVLLIDGFGWRFFSRMAEDYPFLRRILQEGVVSKLTSQFPSTTTAHITTMHTGRTVGDHGLYEWHVYEPQLDAIITPLMYSYAGENARETLKKAALNPNTLFPQQTIYQSFAEQGIASYVMNHHSYAISPYSKAVMNGAKLIPYHTPAEALITLGQLLEKEKGSAYYYLYFDTADALSHHYGPESPHQMAELDILITALERLLYPLLAKRDDTVLIITADHGQVEVHPETTFYLNREMPNITHWIQHDWRDQPLVPGGGSARDLFLHIKPQHLEVARFAVADKLAGKAEVYETQELIDEGLFGPLISDSFLARVGNLTILPYAHESVWWYEEGRFQMRFEGHHGGLTREEMETIFLVQSFKR
jgi:predicted AlkP superfamily pyrophosphatase or phosphodiesterase